MSTSTLSIDLATYKVDASHSRAGFSVRHMGFSKVRGRFGSFEATIEMDESDLASAKASATIDATSIDTGDVKRDEHLKSGEFFDVNSFPEILFESTGVSNIIENSFTLHGNLTIRGITKQIDLDASFLGSGLDPWGGTRIAFEASQSINRKDFGLNWNAILEAGGVLVSETVELTLELQAVKQ